MKLSKWPYIKKPLIIGIITSVIIVLPFVYFCETKKLMEITKSINNVIITFFLAFLAFSITALALLSFVQSQEWFNKVSKSPYFISFLDRFFLSTRISLVLLSISISCLLLEQVYSIVICTMVLLFFFFWLFFLVAWVWKCLGDLFDIFKD
jgi:hypothetical protein